NLKKQQTNLLKTHPGFSDYVYSFNTVTGSFSIYDSIKQLPVTSLLFQDRGLTYLISGEVAPGVRTAEVNRINTENRTGSFGLINYTVLGLYLLVSVLIGLYFSKKQKSTEDYFKGGGRIPWWASGL